MKLKFKSPIIRSKFISRFGLTEWGKKVIDAIENGANWQKELKYDGYYTRDYSFGSDYLTIIESVHYFEVGDPDGKAWFVANEHGAITTTDKNIAEHFSIVNKAPVTEVPFIRIDGELYVSIDEVKMDESLQTQIDKRLKKLEVANKVGMKVKDLENLFRN
ncbi:hypothetical protein AP1_0137 [Aeromonas phage AP1]|nr:hypothetical protein AP1_0137 [Aeromonas phage AP1]